MSRRPSGRLASGVNERPDRAFHPDDHASRLTSCLYQSDWRPFHQTANSIRIALNGERHVAESENLNDVPQPDPMCLVLYANSLTC